MAKRAPIRKNLTDRAKRYRAQKNVTGPKVCVLCGSTENVGVMHLDGFEDNGEDANLAWGCKSCNGVLSAAFKKFGMGVRTDQYNPSKGVPTFQQYTWAVVNHTRGAHDEGGAIIHATPKHKRVEYARRIAEAAGRTKRERYESRWNPAPKVVRTPYGGYVVRWTGKDGKPRESQDIFKSREDAESEALHVERTLKSNPSAFDKCVASVSKKGGADDPRAVCASAGRKKYGQAEMTRRAVAGKKRAARKKNPSGAAAEAFEEFHGFASDELIVVEEQRHHHKHLAAAGELEGLQVKPIGRGLPLRKIEGLGGAVLAFNEAKNQLFIKGGDQSLSDSELRKFGIETDHELQTIGKLVAVGYETDKTHLGDEGGHAIYTHTFRTTNENGVHITVKIARFPDLIYRVLDEQFEISGGDYEILREGINK